MKRKSARKKLLELLEFVPPIKEILLSGVDLEEKRKRIAAYLTFVLVDAVEHDPDISPLEWVLVRDSTILFRTLFSARNEKLAGFSLLRYLEDMLKEDSAADIQEPSPGFFAELEHLLRGITGKSGVYKERYPAFTKHRGREAAKMRSADLSRIAKDACGKIDEYISGLDKEIIRKRSLNKQRILKHFRATDYEWEDWRWHVKHIIRDAGTLASLVELTEEQNEAVRLANRLKVPFGITPYYLSLMDNDPGSVRDRAVRAQVIPTLHYVKKLHELKLRGEGSMDFMLEHDTSPIDGITRRYPMIVILKPILTCPQICVYCQRNWEITDVYDPTAAIGKKKLDAALEWIENTPEIREVLITGGDPLLLGDSAIENILYRLSKIERIERIRIGTRTPVTLPQRFTDSLVRRISRFHHPGKREIIFVTHFEHPYEITPQAMEAVQKLRRCGIEVLNQLVYTFFVSRRFEASALREKLRLIGVSPYYTFNTKGKEETDEYRVPIARLLQEQKEEARLLPGSVRTDEVVFNVPGLGKNYLRAWQHHDVIAILPDGRRVYEFHPWEKKLTLVDTYIYTDVSIYEYLKRLKSIGEDTDKYRSVWYYY